jgi:hypothetical protein
MDVSEQWPLSLLKSPKREPKPKPVPTSDSAYGSTDASAPADAATERSHTLSIAESITESVHEAWDKKIFPKLPKTVDTLLCVLGLVITLDGLLVVENLSGFRLYSLSMSASGIIFFAPSSPPQVQGFLVGTGCGATISWGLFSLLPFQVACGLAAGTVLFFFKTFNVIFPPTAVLGVLISQEIHSNPEHANMLSLTDWGRTAWFILTPWLTGHAILYIAAIGNSHLRRVVRKHMMRGQLAGLAPHASREELKKIFEKFDTSGDGFLDADELRIALRSTRGVDVPLEECEEMIGSIDADGDGVISLEEFISLHDDHLL